ncbi:biotin synthase BioB [Buchnera aphidicola]|uniref:Biotin synthase n=1 Tax=Buchnera aphidicola (Stegophylla sp.) TaxID=2315800 RepID=A0A4D6YED9_9GAMM|nr:biotin synthase BioB [Buchnera aphidicola (Stegophylla sp.)]QCI26363.1 biotin synthase BioB [Buchnera aphidicola (Stegophylla sp.)]
MKKIWNIQEIKTLFKKPFLELIFEAQKIHRKHFNPSEIQISTLLSIKTGLCPEDCKYCAQSSRYKTNIKVEKLLKIDEIIEKAKQAKQSGSDRFCMGAAWKHPKERDMPYLIKIIQEVKKLGLETCMTLGSLNDSQAQQLYDAGLDFYNHNLDTSPKVYKKIITTRTYQDRLNTLNIIQKTGIKICSGGILGLGEKTHDRAELLMQLANLKKIPDSIPINMLVNIKGTPMENNKKINTFDFIKTIAVARIMMPQSYIRLSAGRENMSKNMQTMCFIAGVNSIFYGCKLLTTNNPKQKDDLQLFQQLGLYPKKKIIYNKNLKNINTLNTKMINNTSKYYNAIMN